MSHVYVGRWVACDCIAAACVDEPEHRKDVAKAVATYIRRGYRVERIALAEVGDWRCPAHPEGTLHPWDLK